MSSYDISSCRNITEDKNCVDWISLRLFLVYNEAITDYMYSIVSNEGAFDVFRVAVYHVDSYKAGGSFAVKVKKYQTVSKFYLKKTQFARIINADIRSPFCLLSFLWSVPFVVQSCYFVLSYLCKSETHNKRQVIRHDCLPRLLGGGDTESELL